MLSEKEMNNREDQQFREDGNNSGREAILRKRWRVREYDNSGITTTIPGERRRFRENEDSGKTTTIGETTFGTTMIATGQFPVNYHISKRTM